MWYSPPLLPKVYPKLIFPRSAAFQILTPQETMIKLHSNWIYWPIVSKILQSSKSWIFYSYLGIRSYLCSLSFEGSNSVPSQSHQLCLYWLLAFFSLLLSSFFQIPNVPIGIETRFRFTEASSTKSPDAKSREGKQNTCELRGYWSFSNTFPPKHPSINPKEWIIFSSVSGLPKWNQNKGRQLRLPCKCSGRIILNCNS